MNTEVRNRAAILAAERGYAHPTLRNGRLKVWYDGEEVDWVAIVLAPRGLVQPGQSCYDWDGACLLLGMVPPARGLESHATAVQYRIQGAKLQ